MPGASPSTCISDRERLTVCTNRPLMLWIRKYGFICGNTDYRGQLDHVQSPGSISQDLTFYVQTMMNTGRAEFMKRYGESPLVKKKFDILADYIENELLIDLNY